MKGYIDFTLQDLSMNNLEMSILIEKINNPINYYGEQYYDNKVVYRMPDDNFDKASDSDIAKIKSLINKYNLEPTDLYIDWRSFFKGRILKHQAESILKYFSYLDLMS